MVLKPRWAFYNILDLVTYPTGFTANPLTLDFIGFVGGHNVATIADIEVCGLVHRQGESVHQAITWGVSVPSHFNATKLTCSSFLESSSVMIVMLAGPESASYWMSLESWMSLPSISFFMTLWPFWAARKLKIAIIYMYIIITVPLIF